MILSFLECNEHYLNLENRPNKTPAEQQELTDKKEQLNKLNQQQNKIYYSNNIRLWKNN